MHRLEIKKKVNHILSILLERKISENDEVVFSQDGAWHSIKLIELVYLLEETFQITLNAEQVLFINSNDIVKCVENHLQNRLDF
ncbi:MAG: hypothetical protein ACD_46C00262G0017 [uncultured bacterium]|nr:MAG: hypothetical protein ACD_46C00262G0017 [uncultured bacterium]